MRCSIIEALGHIGIYAKFQMVRKSKLVSAGAHPLGGSIPRQMFMLHQRHNTCYECATLFADAQESCHKPVPLKGERPYWHDPCGMRQRCFT